MAHQGNAPTVGQEMADFDLEAYCPETGTFCRAQLHDILSQGKWCVVFFYPADFTAVCPTELYDLSEVHDVLEELNCQVIAVSSDTRHTHLAWHRQESLLKDVRFPMASDIGGRIASALGVLDERTGLPLRATFIINPSGIILDKEVSYFNVGRNARELMRKVEANIYQADNPDEVCPAGWQPGDDTLTPDEDLVGRVGEVYVRKQDREDED